MKPKALILTGHGINCDMETAFAFQRAKASADRVHLNDVIDRRVRLEDYHILAIPGGFSFGDDVASGKILANKLKFNLKEQIEQFIEDQKLIIGICNGFQVMVKFGMLPGLDNDYFTQSVTLTFNDSGRFENRWVNLKINKKSKCVFTRGIDSLYLVVRHGEGKFIPQNEEILERIKKNNQVVAHYTDDKGNITGYPWNPNGSRENIAALCDSTGRIFGLMPHPEAHIHKTNHPKWTRPNFSDNGNGLPIFQNAVEWVTEHF